MSTPSTPAPTPMWVRIFGVVLALVGLALLLGGLRLATLGGSWYYLIAGLATLVSGALLVRGKAQGPAVPRRRHWNRCMGAGRSRHRVLGSCASPRSRAGAGFCSCAGSTQPAS